MNKFKLEKGMLIAVQGIWHVVTEIMFDKETKKTWLNCICDNANNRYSWETTEIDFFLSCKDIADFGYVGWPEEIPEELRERKIPHDVVTEVLLGRENDRFSDYYE